MDTYDFGNNIKILEKLIKSVVFPKFPKLVKIEDIEHFGSSFRGDTYFVNIVTSECLDSEEQVEIDKMVKELFFMSSLDSANKSKSFKISDDTIKVFFDCGDGWGFKFSSNFGYEH